MSLGVTGPRERYRPGPWTDPGAELHRGGASQWRSGQGRLRGEADQGPVGGVTQQARVVDGAQAADLAGFVELDAGVAAAHRGGVRGRRPLVAATPAAALGVHQRGAGAVRELSERPRVVTLGLDRPVDAVCAARSSTRTS